MKFSINLEEFWMDEDSGDLECELKKDITNAVTQKIMSEIKDKIDEEIKDKVTNFVDARMSVIINDALEQCINNDTIKPRHGSEIKISSYIKDQFENDSGWGNPDKHINKIAKSFGEELKLQYNNLFANKIVQNMKEQGLLKDEVVQILLGGDS
jgi:hypothetical protein